MRKQAIVKIHNEYINIDKYNATLQHKSYQLIQYLLTINDEKFREEFSIHSDEDLDMLVQFSYEYKVRNLTELKIKASIAKHIEYGYIYSWFSN